jgi:alkylation response protein AidB-like acyl-CoA dehydrogenase
MSDDDKAFRAEIGTWMQASLQGEFECLRHRGGPGDEDAYPELRKRWEQHLAKARWTCVGWPEQHGGRNLSPARQVIFHEEYARAGGPGRVGHLGETLIGPTLIALGSEDQRRRFLPGIVAGTEYWCQGYSEPNAGSDLGNVQTRARQEAGSGDWIVDGQKVWTSLAHESQWIFVLARHEPGSRGNKGLIFLLMPLQQPGIEVRPIKQLTGTSEFSEVFFDGARARGADVIDAPGDGWKVAMTLLGFERGLSTLGQQAHFDHELQLLCAAARANGAARNPLIRDRIARAWMGLKAMRYNAMRMLADRPDGAADGAGLIAKYYWSNWHRDFGKLAADVLGFDADIASNDPALLRLQQVFFFSRADTIYAGTNEIQLNIIAERGLGMPREARPAN